MKKYIMTKGQMKRQFAEFCSVIEKFVPRFKKEIDEKEMIYIKARDLAKDMGPKFQEKHPVSFYMGARSCLWDSGIYVGAKTKNHEPTLIMRYRTKEDKFFIK